ncbi:MAG: diaminopimelate epimerase [Bradymonadaceae bacterium]
MSTFASRVVMPIGAFEKFHGLGNDFVLVDRSELQNRELPGEDAARRLCDRSRGIGADGLLIVERTPDAEADARMTVLNADGTRPEMCGNGLRCVAARVAETGSSTEVTIASDSGLHGCRVERTGPSAWRVDAAMGRIELDDRAIAFDGFRLIPVDVGNPHAVVFAEPGRRAELMELGEALNAPDSPFPDGVNLEFVRRTGPGAAEVAVFERGVGVTPACGTGACAAAAAICAREGTDAIDVDMPGGTVSVVVDGDEVTLGGTVHRVYEGTWRGRESDGEAGWTDDCHPTDGNGR